MQGKTPEKGERELDEQPERSARSGHQTDDVSGAPESGQPGGGRDTPWGTDGRTDPSWPPPPRPAPKDEL